ncbi:MAG: glycerol-3-phosphate dehydrogenase/oxidase [Gammaproteobacteria bacterium]|uniref:glycerol-3-phosphate dehydrogenase/oxidase n=1 Tax=Rhodoferax sp. TaxID=50421 RepID=UPI0017BF8989|nr:glycerol-3-phosphate dehydrogenase/oxidase [Rhodoferax sp.]MBU3899602.1 glycerol-3-phosphate dehydrogenase/oxidase [Gammaproteobacteria bacterium]MBA3056598.1 glycerol-3-phosphate dehydrogenase/oxidase [Rhodoferax sp.]MBU3998933.1 glycerol-3-phosphate dehydrogenase/oxidase [Gammaproteobacteria bacterium]MBU4018078.1 glycerol-3-phosphate dehydrogenase/oxidase [Gammaproteobacteria bacterium]MBU4080231.1 glycerol-3-phosphate dehydrogenase/oxidase [Gammaproteobacteria bacterium]
MGELTSGAERAGKLAQLDAPIWDLVVIGGGISGAGVAQQAARRGWKVLLIEQRDFAWGTSSRSSKLVHGGLRYLKEGDIKTTLHSVRERQRLMQEAPELIEPQSFLFANCLKRKPGRWLFQSGLMIYDLMAGMRSHFWADLPTTQTLAPGLGPPRMRGALVFQDAKTDDARLVWRVLMQAQRDGATLLNYVAAQGLQLNAGRVAGVTVQDGLTGQTYQVRTKAVVNATGAWADRLRGAVGGKPMLRPLRGSHLVLPFWRLPVAQAISLMHPKDGRPVFLYPWEGATLIGTTDLDHRADIDVEASITPQEVDYLIDAVNDQFPAAALKPLDVSACYAGVRPVVDDGKGAASQAARDHVVLDESGLITLTGGKLTTFRLMAQDALALAAPHVGRPFAKDEALIFTPVDALNPRWSASVRHRLAARYGYLAGALSQQASEAELQTIAGTQTLWLELRVAAQFEAVVHLDDLLLRRTRLGILLPRGALDHLTRIRALCAPHLDWDDARWTSEIERYRALIAAHYQLPQIKPETTKP